MLLVQKGVGTRSHNKNSVGTPFPPHYTPASNQNVLIYTTHIKK